jgi:hypothetical protein
MFCFRAAELASSQTTVRFVTLNTSGMTCSMSTSDFRSANSTDVFQLIAIPSVELMLNELLSPGLTILNALMECAAMFRTNLLKPR